MRTRTVRGAFTLIELLVVIAILAVLIGLLVPAVQKVRESASRLSCQNNLKQIGLALHNYHDGTKRFPPGYLAASPYVNGGTDTTPGWGWATYLLPYLEQTALANQLNLCQPIPNFPATQALVPTYICPSDIVNGAFAVTDSSGRTVCVAGPSSYAGCCGGSGATTAATGMGLFYRNSRTRLLDIRDGSSNTIAVCERAWARVQGVWVGAINTGICNQGQSNPAFVAGKLGQGAADLVLTHSTTNNSPIGRGLDDSASMHTGGSNFLLADGSVHFLRDVLSGTTDSLTLQAMGTRAGGEVLPSELLD